MVGGIGIDCCEVARIRQALDAATGARFRARVFTAAERAYCEGRGVGRFESYAARFAAKEAAMKVLGTGWGEGVRWHDVEVVAAPGHAPVLRLRGGAARHARALRLGRWLLSLTHTRDLALAWVLAEEEPVATAVSAVARSRTPRRRAAATGSARPRPTRRR